MNGKIRTLVFLGFTAAAALPLSGCIIDSSSSNSCSRNRYITAEWDIVGIPGDVPLTCEEANAARVRMTVQGVPYFFSCSAYSGFTTSGIQSGNYSVSLDLLSPQDAILSSVGPNPVYVPSCDPLDLPTVTFPVL